MMSKKYSMFSNGTVIVHEGADVRKASKEEVLEHVTSMLPETYQGEALKAVAFNVKDGCVYGKYATRKVKKTVFAQQATSKTEPVDGSQKVKDTKVPSDKSKAKPETGQITKDRPDVGKPTEIRTKDYQLGKGGENLHSEEVPRSEKDGGLKGGSVATTCEETGDKQTSGNPETYVQDLGDTKKPTPAGNEMNHAAGSEIKWHNDSTIYNNLKLAKEDDKKDNLPPWLQKDKKDDDSGDEKKDDDKKGDDKKDDDKKDDDKKECKECKCDPCECKKASSEELNQIKTALQAKEAEVASHQVKIARIEKAARYALALLQLNPNKYNDPERFIDVINQTAERMDEHAIQIAIDELGEIYAERDRTRTNVQTASPAQGVDQLWAQEDKGGLSTAIVIPEQDDYVPSEPKMGIK